jgi:3-deoxy-manno-octulosonate cytidylyltransferase (CMP-KDO synthetase)
MKAVAVIPARMGSSRFPGKPLAPIAGRPMIEHVYRRVALAEAIDSVYVATCDEEIARESEAFGAEAIMTSAEHERASDRVAEAAGSLDADVVVMVQGDEPLTTPQMVEEALAPLRRDPDVGCSNLIAPIVSEEELRDPNTIKVVRDRQNRALFMSRAPIPTAQGVPFERIEAWKQVCVIPFRRESLFEFAALSPTPLEVAESIDMLRFLEHGRDVHLVETGAGTQAVDTPEDLRLVEALMREDPLLPRYAASVP